MRHATEPYLVCADHRVKLSSRITTDGDGGIVELIDPCRECRRPRFVARTDRPAIRTSKSGVQSVSPSDIIQSTVGQKQISDTAQVAFRTLICDSCGKPWQRPAQRGRTPKKCEGCRG